MVKTQKALLAALFSASLIAILLFAGHKFFMNTGHEVLYTGIAISISVFLIAFLGMKVK